MKKLMVLMMAALMVLATACNGGTSTSSSSQATTPASSDSSAAAPAASSEGSSGETGGYADKITVSVMTWDAAESFNQDGTMDEMYQYLSDRFGLIFEPVNIGWDDYEEKGRLWAAAGTLPDVIGGMDWVGRPTYTEWVESGIIRAIPSDLSAYPQLSELMATKNVQDYAVDGVSYMIPRGTGMPGSWTAMARGIINRKDWREQLNIPIPKTNEDYIAMWKAFASNDMNGDGSKTYGLLPDQKGVLYDQTFYTFGDTREQWSKLEDGTMVMPSFEPTALPLLSFYRQAFKEGCFDADFITNSIMISTEVFASGRSGTLLRQVSPKHINIIYDHWVKLQPDKNFFDCIEFLDPPMQDGITPLLLRDSGFWSETYFNSSVNDETMERLLKYFDFCYSDEGVRLLRFGFEGKDYKMEGDEVIMLTEINPESGQNFNASHLYKFASGGMSNLANWPADAAEYYDPTIPKEIRDMSISLRDRITTTYDTCFNDNRIRSISIPETSEFVVQAKDEWVDFITNTTDISDQELFDQFYARWVANGYEAAKEAMTAEVARLGY